MIIISNVTSINIQTGWQYSDKKTKEHDAGK